MVKNCISVIVVCVLLAGCSENKRIKHYINDHQFCPLDTVVNDYSIIVHYDTLAVNLEKCLRISSIDSFIVIPGLAPDWFVSEEIGMHYKGRTIRDNEKRLFIFSGGKVVYEESLINYDFSHLPYLKTLTRPFFLVTKIEEKGIKKERHYSTVYYIVH